MTREKFIAAYLEELRARYPWAQDAAKLDSFRASVENTLNATRGASWAWDGPSTLPAFRKIGCKGPMTLKALRALPKESAQ